MLHTFRNRGFFAVVAVLFAATTWLNWTAAPSEEGGTRVAAVAQVYETK
jgi:hypothetical protein